MYKIFKVNRGIKNENFLKVQKSWNLYKENNGIFFCIYWVYNFLSNLIKIMIPIFDSLFCNIFHDKFLNNFCINFLSHNFLIIFFWSNFFCDKFSIFGNHESFLAPRKAHTKPIILYSRARGGLRGGKSNFFGREKNSYH